MSLLNVATGLMSSVRTRGSWRIIIFVQINNFSNKNLDFILCIHNFVSVLFIVINILILWVLLNFFSVCVLSDWGPGWLRKWNWSCYSQTWKEVVKKFASFSCFLLRKHFPTAYMKLGVNSCQINFLEWLTCKPCI